ncbi:helix-turn-helix transcriptional regulator [Cohnella rhizosphaerae]|uniref:PAS domain-containing protein n=1 Tax=Cohnella rhizosphaerae TaxID=1457232 RepID=A0A9X4KV49_9BACL|nr:PAS domain-containing protein [Cohnella rhizosphaerae]MDG0811430.1 PAS domain-containing protein [Cohnella rhizosphaerae]
MTPDEILDSYKPMTAFIAQVYGRGCEVILHDLRRLESSIVAISNNHITGREVGGSITDFALKILHDKTYEGQDFIANYAGQVPDKKMLLRSSTFFIRDEERNVIGMLCVNVDVTALQQARAAIDDLLLTGGDTAPTSDSAPASPQEDFAPSMEELLRRSIAGAIERHGVPPVRMHAEEKKRIVGELSGKGIFLLKGAVTEVARSLEASEQTIYRYLKELT